MKPIKLYLIAFVVMAGALIISSCEKTKVDVEFKLDVANIYFNIDTTSLSGDISFATTTFNSELQKKLDENNANMDEVESIEISSASFTMINPGTQNFDPIDKVYAYLSASGLSEVRVAYRDPVPDGVTVFALDGDAGNYKEYLKQSVVTFRASGFTNAPNVERDSIQAKITFKIQAKVQP